MAQRFIGLNTQSVRKLFMLTNVIIVCLFLLHMSHLFTNSKVKYSSQHASKQEHSHVISHVTRNSHKLEPDQSLAFVDKSNNGKYPKYQNESEDKNMQNVEDAGVAAESRNKPRFGERFRLLTWTGFYGGLNATHWMRAGPGLFRGCEFSNCEIVTDRGDVSTSDAVLVHMPNVRRRADLPPSHPPWQLWYMVMFEPPTFIFYNASDFNGAFNATVTYSRRSTIWAPIGHVQQTTEQVAVFRPYALEMKSKLVAWFVSHCPTPGKRLQYARELQKHMPVDIYGVCGNMTCSPKQQPVNGRRECYDMLDRDYKFYLSFENSFCEEYITEKVWRVLELHVVPVVLGGADYVSRLPPHSYIDIRDFRSPSALADYLRMLDENDTLYEQYFAWKPHYEVKGWEYRCRMCEHMNVRNASQVSVIDRVDAFWDHRTQCQSPREFYGDMIEL